MKISWVRTIASVTLVAGWGTLDTIVRSTSTVISAEQSVHQLDNSDAAYIAQSATTHLLSGMALPTILLGVLLIAIWWKPLKNLVTGTPSSGNNG